MEPAGVMSEVNWGSFTGMISNDEAEFMAQLLGTYLSTNEQEPNPSFGNPSTFWTSREAPNMTDGDGNLCYYSSDNVNTSLCTWPQGNSSSLFIPTSNYENYCTVDPTSVPPGMYTSSASVDLRMMEPISSSSLRLVTENAFEETAYLNEEISSDELAESGGKTSESVPSNSTAPLKRKLPMPDRAILDSNNTNTNENPKKKSRVSCNVQSNGRSAQSKKIQKLVMIPEEEESNAAFNAHSCSSYSSEDDSNASQEQNGGATSSSKGSTALNLNGKSRASRGSATDPQSLYARKRRERINERLRILQNLVPNGTKVDISTMLEEAVQYVKFLQLQIKLLSSDDLWMYAPLAYNGMDIGLDLKISSKR